MLVADAHDIFEEVTLDPGFPAFLTVPAYDRFLYQGRKGSGDSVGEPVLMDA
ncbi:hypothetical protein QFZ79_001705 [Arthrobacter sp. V4I6]|uniref:hypothetical protein n=1 Tax=unclassified Arthrobacter TaxID=235627 RepID=UPI002787A530|nr:MULTISPECIES: hypothetical protein [unclassified Arthrobacter]MDQ0819410.1 hypothetical protein [Arthrobacter sp. V1I7]MDQ0853594.1 hypothetical protein [Arthrobacter sp. V4I6]